MLALGVLIALAPACAHWRDTFAGSPRTATETVTRLDGRGRIVSQTRTSKPVHADAVFRILDAGGIIFVRLAIVVLSAFLAGGLVQRVLMARYGFKLGPLDLPELQETIAASEKIVAEIAAQQTEAASQSRTIAGLLEQQARSADAIARLSRGLATLQDRVVQVESKS